MDSQVWRGGKHGCWHQRRGIGWTAELPVNRHQDTTAALTGKQPKNIAMFKEAIDGSASGTRSAAAFRVVDSFSRPSGQRTRSDIKSP